MADILQLVSFNLGSEEFALDIGAVQEIVRMPEITKVPRSADFVEGVVNLRGKIIPVVDLRRRFQLPAGKNSKSTRIIIVTIGGRTVGMIVDGVSEVLRLGTDRIDAAPDLVTSAVDACFIRGIAKLEGRLLILLDLDLILTREEASALARVS